MSDSLLFVTQVAPYRDGPAGVHGVLDQAAVGVAQVAEMHGLRSRRVDDVRDVSVDDIRAARALALFTIGETPWSTDQQDAILECVRAGRLAVCAIHSATDACYSWDAYGEIVGALRAKDIPAARAALASDIGRAFDLLRDKRRGAGAKSPQAGAGR